MQSQGQELPGGNIELDMIFNKTPTDKRQTKIFCTLGPACWDVPKLEELIHAGLNVARFNFSHGDHEGHKACLDRLRQAVKNTGKNVGKSKLDRMEWIKDESFENLKNICRSDGLNHTM